jgi:hypothetical protein
LLTGRLLIDVSAKRAGLASGIHRRSIDVFYCIQKISSIVNKFAICLCVIGSLCSQSTASSVSVVTVLALILYPRAQTGKKQANPVSILCTKKMKTVYIISETALAAGVATKV